MNDAPPHDDLITLLDDDGPVPASSALAWQILVVDDDQEVHHATLFSLQGAEILGRPLSFLHAYSAAEAIERLNEHPDVAVILLDVVMESNDAGLRLVQRIRNDLERDQVRIILRTGQPGYAPELEAIRRYDINDYKTKSELTHTRLVTALTTAIRSFEQIRTISESRRGLSQIVDSARDLFTLRSIDSFARGVVTQIAGLLRLPPDGILCAQKGDPNGGGSDDTLYVVGATGRYGSLIGQPLEQIDDPRIPRLLAACIEQQTNLYLDQSTVLYIPSGAGRRAAVFLDTDRPLNEQDQRLIEVFSVNIALSYDNVHLFQQLHEYAYRDPLCRLSNRTAFVQRVDLRLRDGCRDWTLALLDVDDFAQLNDSLGHHLGDRLLVALSERLQAAMGEACEVARTSGDNFGVFGPSTWVNPERLGRLFAVPFRVDAYNLPIWVTAGMVETNDMQPGEDAATLMKCASIALKRAKSTRRGQHEYYTNVMEQETRERMALIHGMRQALEDNRFELYYQPQVDLANGNIIGSEALLRWKTADGRFIPPTRFIPLAESSGLIIDLGAWVIRDVFRQVSEWSRPGQPNLRYAINVSMPQFRSNGFLKTLERALYDFGIDPSVIELEITESMVMDDADATIRRLRELKNLGFTIAIDDFGTGYSSLSHLHRLPIDRLKIDRSFVMELDDTGRPGAQIAETVVALGRRLGLTLIAEGVELDVHANILRNWGCQEAQGYFYWRPMPAADFRGLFA